MEDLKDFLNSLQSHQIFKAPNGKKNYENVFLEHNLLVTSKYFKDIRIESLSEKVGLSVDELEKFLQDMKNDEKIKVMIDHRKGLVTFKDSKFIGFNFSGQEIILESRMSLINFFEMLEDIC